MHVYLPFIRDFLSSQVIQAGCLSQDAFDTLSIRNFLLAQTKGRSEEYTRLLATSLRSFFRFLFFTGETARDLSSSVPMVRKYRMSKPPSFLSPEQTERLCRVAPVGSTRPSRGRSSLLGLDDIRWRSGEILIRGKGRMLDHLPLVCDVGEALAADNCHDRGVSASRRGLFTNLGAARRAHRSRWLVADTSCEKHSPAPGCGAQAAARPICSGTV